MADSMNAAAARLRDLDAVADNSPNVETPAFAPPGQNVTVPSGSSIRIGERGEVFVDGQQRRERLQRSRSEQEAIDAEPTATSERTTMTRHPSPPKAGEGPGVRGARTTPLSGSF